MSNPLTDRIQSAVDAANAEMRRLGVTVSESDLAEHDRIISEGIDRMAEEIRDAIDKDILEELFGS